MIARLRARLHGGTESGLSLVELLVTMLLTGLLLAMVGGLFVSVARATSDSNASTQKTSTAANALNEVVKVIKGGANNTVAAGAIDPAFVAATSTAVTLYSYSDTTAAAPAPTKVAFRLDGANLLEDRWTGTNTKGYWEFTGTATTRVIGTGTSAVFSYVLADTSVVTGTTALTLEQRQAIREVKVTITVANRTTTSSDPIVLYNTVVLPNLNTSGIVK